MDLETIKFFFLGLIQGLTEPIPVSSSGHLLMLSHYFGVGLEEDKQLGFAVMVNFASLLAVLLIYRDDLFRLAKNSALYLKDRSDEYQSDFKFVLFILLGTIPAGVLGVLFSDVLEEHLTGVKVIGGALLVTAFALWVIRNLKGAKNDGDLTIREALIIGFAQAIALIPGISRSGSTIVAGMLAGLKQDTALRFSFMLFIPVSLGGVVLESEGLCK